jgi:phosphoribosyl 1,2-cyclic phosphate phosphodiesterase
MTNELLPKRNNLQVTLLGTGTSVGIPIIGCDCKTCTSDDPRDKRLRCSCLVEVNGLSILIDTSPDFRYQAIAHDIRHVDAILFTHHHFDHIAGIDDIRPYLFGNRKPIPCYAHPDAAASLEIKYDYIFGSTPHPSAPRLDLLVVREPFQVRGRNQSEATVDIVPIPVVHRELEIYGYRFGPFAYVTDASALATSAVDLLNGVDILVLNALRPRPHPSHLSVSQAIDAARRTGARMTYFIHMTHDILHARDNARLPAGFEYGYDGQHFSLPYRT